MSVVNKGVFKGVFSCQYVACEDAGWAAYSQLHLHVTGEYNHSKLVSVVKTTECYTPSGLHAASLTCIRALSRKS